MKTSKNIIILTGTDQRHQFFIQHLNAHFSISEVYLEKNNYSKPKFKSIEESIAWNWFFDNRRQYESKQILGSKQLIPKNSPKVNYIETGDFNSPEIISKIEDSKPGFIAVFGTSLFKNNFLKIFSNILFNLHIGDPEFYRGSSCNFWPIYERQLKHMSATIHRIDNRADTGEIAYKEAIKLSRKDNEQILLFKPLKLGAKLMIKTIKTWQKQKLKTIPQKRIGKLYKKSEFTPTVVLELKDMVESGELNKHLQSYGK